MKYYDQHTHSSYSKDSKCDLENYYKCAQLENINYVCTCEHFDYMTVCDKITWDCDFDDLIRYQKVLNNKYENVKGLLGVELGYKKTSLEPITKLSNKYDFDIIQLSIHDDDVHDFYFKEAFIGNEINGLNKYFEQILEGISCFDNFDVLSHIDYGFKTVKKFMTNLDIKEFEPVIKKIMLKVIEKGKSFEINTKAQSTINEINNDYSHTRYLLNLYKSLGGEKLTLSSDAHEASRYREGFDTYISLIKECGFNSLRYYIKRKEYIYEIN